MVGIIDEEDDSVTYLFKQLYDIMSVKKRHQYIVLVVRVLCSVVWYRIVLVMYDMNKKNKKKG